MEIARHWRLTGQRYRLEGSACAVCGRLSFPPRLVCPDCTAYPVPIAASVLSIFPARISLGDIQMQLSRPFAAKLVG
jgi:hypothetical protein